MMTTDLSCILIKLDYLDEKVINRAIEQLGNQYGIITTDYETFIRADKLIEIIEDYTDLVSDLEDKEEEK